jgi:hypothetical protein
VKKHTTNCETWGDDGLSDESAWLMILSVIVLLAAFAAIWVWDWFDEKIFSYGKGT